MNRLHHAMTGAVLIFGFMMLIKASDNSNLEVSDVQEKSIRDKRFSDTNCAFSSFNKICKFTCKDVGQFLVCFTAKLDAVIPETAAVEIEGNVNGLSLFFQCLGRQSDPNPPPKCTTSSVFRACMSLKNVNPSALSACIELTDETSNSTYEMGCFSTTLFATAEVTTIARTASGSTIIRTEHAVISSTVDNTSQRNTSPSTDVSTSTEDVNGSQRIEAILILPLIGFAILRIFCG